MKIILLKDVPKVGRKYDIKNVADGYAVNMLLPRGLAQLATPDAVKKIELLKSQDLTEKSIQNELLLKSLEVIKNLKINIKEKANDKGHLFAGITRERIAEEIEKLSRLKIDPSSIKLDKPIKEVGQHIMILDVLNKKAEFLLNIESL
jgi:large subunit ribosomal protein L9